GLRGGPLARPALGLLDLAHPLAQRLVLPAARDEHRRQHRQGQHHQHEGGDEEARAAAGEGHGSGKGERGNGGKGDGAGIDHPPCSPAPTPPFSSCSPQARTRRRAYCSARSRFSTVFHSNRLWKSYPPVNTLGVGSPFSESRAPSVPPRMSSIAGSNPIARAASTATSITRRSFASM